MKINRKVWHINYGIPDKTGNMQNINSSNFITKKLKQLPLLRIQDGFFAFTEMPSDKYDQLKDEVSRDITNNRINALELFSIFTADIIKEKVVFIR